jgi:hypothetical protein
MSQLIVQAARLVTIVEGQEHDVSVEAVRTVVEVNPSTTLSTFIGEAYLHEQNVPATTWTVSHGLDRDPAVSVISSIGEELEAAITHIDTNTLLVRLNGAATGKAACN